MEENRTNFNSNNSFSRPQYPQPNTQPMTPHPTQPVTPRPMGQPTPSNSMGAPYPQRPQPNPQMQNPQMRPQPNPNFARPNSTAPVNPYPVPNVQSTQPEINPTDDLRAKLKADNVHLKKLEEINEENIRSHRSRTKRDRVIIIVLIVLLIGVVAGIASYLTITTLKSNTFMYAHGDANCKFIVDGEELNKFRTPPEIQGNRILSFNLEMNINSGGNYNVKYTVDVYQGNMKIDNVIIYNPSNEFFNGYDGYYYSTEALSGNRNIKLFEGVLIDRVYENTLNISNFKMEVHVYLERA